MKDIIKQLRKNKDELNNTIHNLEIDHNNDHDIIIYNLKKVKKRNRLLII